MKVFFHDKVFVLKKTSFAKTAISSLKKSELEIFLRLTQPQLLQCKYLEIKELQGHFLSPKNGGTIKKHIALNLYIGTNVLVYERWLVLKVWYTAGWLTLSPLHRLTLFMYVSQKVATWQLLKITNKLWLPSLLKLFFQ